MRRTFPAGDALPFAHYNTGFRVASIGTDEPNDRPIAANDAYTTNEDELLPIGLPGVLVNDTDANSDTLTSLLVSGPSHGTLTLNLDGSFSYMPALNYFGPDRFTYKANDGLKDSRAATVVITVLAVPDAPVAVKDSYRMSEDTRLVNRASGRWSAGQ